MLYLIFGRFHIVKLMGASLMKRKCRAPWNVGLQGTKTSVFPVSHFLWNKLHSWRKKWKPTSVLLSGESHGQLSLAGYTVHGVTNRWTQLSDWTNTPQILYKWSIGTQGVVTGRARRCWKQGPERWIEPHWEGPPGQPEESGLIFRDRKVALV